MCEEVQVVTCIKGKSLVVRPFHSQSQEFAYSPLDNSRKRVSQTFLMPPAAEDGQHREEAANGNGGSFTWLQMLAFLFLTFNSSLALYRSMGDPWNAAFIVLSYAVLLALFYCLRLFETAPSEASRGPLKMWVWVFSAILIVMFTHRVAAIMPLPVAMLVWGLAAATTCGGFYALFVYENEDDTKKNSDKPSKV